MSTIQKSEESKAEGFFSRALSTVSSEKLFKGLQKQQQVPETSNLSKAAEQALTKSKK